MTIQFVRLDAWSQSEVLPSRPGGLRWCWQQDLQSGPGFANAPTISNLLVPLHSRQAVDDSPLSSALIDTLIAIEVYLFDHLQTIGAGICFRFKLDWSFKSSISEKNVIFPTWKIRKIPDSPKNKNVVLCRVCVYVFVGISPGTREQLQFGEMTA